MSALSRDRRFLAALTAIAALSAFLRMETIARRPLWFDERFTFRFCSRADSLAGAWAAAIADAWEHPPLHYTVTYVVMQFSHHPALVRLPSVLCAILTVVLLALLGRRLLGPAGGLLAGLLMAVSIYHINYSMDARPYPMLLLLLTAEMLFLDIYLEKGKRRWLTPLALCAAAALYTHHLALVPQLAVVAMAALPLLRHVRGHALTHSARVPATRLAAGLVAAAIGAILLYLPQARNLYRYLSTENLEQEHTLQVSGAFIWHLSSRWGVGDSVFNILILALLLIGAGGIILRRRRALGLLAWLVIPFLPFVLIPFGKFFDIRFVISALPPFLLIIAAGLTFAGAGLAEATSPWLPAKHRPMAAVLITLLLATPLLAQSAGAYLVFRTTDYRCSEFFLEPDILERDNSFCRRYLILNSLTPEYGFLFKPIAGAEVETTGDAHPLPVSPDVAAAAAPR